METDSQPTEFKSGMIAIVGPPNSGKSTLLNTLLGQKISIVTPKPQTTRNRILGVINDDNYQIILLDTPGLHKSEQILNKEMVRIALDSLADVDGVLFLLDLNVLCKKMLTKDKEEVREYLSENKAPAFLLLNKVDAVHKKDVLPIIEQYKSVYDFSAILPISAKTGEGCDSLIQEVVNVLSPGPQYFPDDIPTDATERFLATEIIREKVFLLTGQEVPYSTAVVIDAFEEKPNKIIIHASIILERTSQKGIVIGKGGHKLKSIGIAARKDLEKMLDQKVNLKLWVKVKKNWSQNTTFLKELGL